MWEKIKELYADRKNLKKQFKWILKLTKPHAKSILMIIFIRCLAAAIGILSSVANKHIVDAAQANNNFTTFVVVAICCTVSTIVLNVTFNISSVYISEKYSCSVRTKIYKDVMAATWTARNKYHSGDYITKMTTDMTVVAHGVVDVTARTLATALQFIMAFSVLWHYDSSLATVGILTGPVIVVVSITLMFAIKKIHNKIQESESAYRVFLQEQFTQTDTVKIFEQEEQGERKFVELQEERMFWIAKRNRVRLSGTAIISAVFSGTYLFAFCLGALKVSSGLISFGTMTAFLSLISQVQNPMYALANLLPQAVGTLASAGRMMEITEMESEEYPESEHLSGAIGLKGENVSLSYGEKKIVSGLDIEIKPGEFIMIKGSSGVGKTTFLRSILGLISPSDGKLFFYDADGNEADCSAATRKYISYVPQGNTLFNGTIAENLRMGKEDATEEEMCEALKVACAWDFVSSLPDGMETNIGEKGGGFSEGQAQRIAIARAMLKPAGIIIMDESTSALDSITEEKILNSLKENIAGRSCLFVSHRESVSRVADRIITITNSLED